MRPFRCLPEKQRPYTCCVVINALLGCQKSPQITCKGYLCLCVCEWHPHRIMPKYGRYLHPHNTHICICTSHPQMQDCGGWQQLCSSTSPTPSLLPHLNTYHSSVPALVVNDCWCWSMLYFSWKLFRFHSLQEFNLKPIFQRSQRCFPSLFICLFAAFAPQIVFWEGFSTQLALGRGWTSLSQNNFLSPLFPPDQSGNFQN